MMQTRLITTENELLSMKDSWNALVRENSLIDYAFYSWEWFYHSWKYSGCPDLFVVTVSDKDHLVGILPLVRCVEKKRGLTMRVLAFCPNGNTPRNNIYFSAAQKEKEIIALVFDRLFTEKKQWDMLQLVNIEQSTTLNSLLTGNEHDACLVNDCLRTDGRLSPHVDVAAGESFDAYLIAHVLQRHRTQIRRNFKRMDSSGKPWHLEHYNTPATLSEGLRYTIEVRNLSWKPRASVSFCDFYESICNDPFLSNHIHIAVLFWEDEPVASQLYLHKNGKYQMLINDHAETHGSLAPGTNLTTLVLMFAFERQWKFLDFSGEAYEYKKRLASGMTQHSNFEIFHSGFKSQMIFLAKKRWLPFLRKLWSIFQKTQNLL